MDTNETQAKARQILRDSWGKGRTLTRDEYEWMDSSFPRARGSGTTAIEMCLRLAGLWEEYKAADFPTWAAFRVWLGNMEIN
jgi:hypothetical protein